MKQKKLSLLFVFLLCFGIFIQSVNTLNLPNAAQDTLTLTFGILYEALPFVFLGVLLSLLIQKYVSQATLLRFLPKKSFVRRVTLSLFGTFLPVCECGNVPMARGLLKKGLKPSEVMTFLFAAPIINPVTIYTTTQAFPTQPEIVVVRVIAAFLIANLLGFVYAKYKSEDVLTPEFENYCAKHPVDTPKRFRRSSMRTKLTHFADSFAEEVSALLPALVGGSLVAGLIQTTLPREFLASISSQPVLAILALMVLAFVISICANVDAFFALSLSSIFPTSAIIAFLVFGPMVDIKMFALLSTTFKKHILLSITGLIFFACFVTGLVVQYAL